MPLRKLEEWQSKLLSRDGVRRVGGKRILLEKKSYKAHFH